MQKLELKAAALIFGGLFFSCSDSDDGDDDKKQLTVSAGDIYATNDNLLYVKVKADSKVDAFMWESDATAYAPVAQDATYIIDGTAITVTVSAGNSFTGTISDSGITLTISGTNYTLSKVNEAPTGPNTSEGDNPQVTKTDFFETFASPTDTPWGSNWVTKGTSKDSPETVTFDSGVKVVCAGDTKFADKPDSTWEDAVSCLQFGKFSNNNFLIVPVKGDCTISVYFDSNKIPSVDCRSLLATVAQGTVSIENGTPASIAFYDCAAQSSRVKKTVVFTYKGEGEDVIFTCNKSAIESAGGACYIYGLKVAYN